MGASILLMLILLIPMWAIPVMAWSAICARRDVRLKRSRPFWCAVPVSAVYTVLVLGTISSSNFSMFAIACAVIFGTTGLLSLISYAVASIRAPRPTLHLDPQELQQSPDDPPAQAETGNPYQPPK